MTGMHLTYTSREVLPGVRHILDPLGVHLTLLTGTRGALLLDCGYGALDLKAYMDGLTDLPLTVLLSHGHHDHALGAMRFPETWMLEEDLPVFHQYTGVDQRRRVLERAGLYEAEAEGYLAARIPPPRALRTDLFDLGGLSARVIPAPGHTPGSLALYVPERRLLLLGDSWNPQTWLFFPEALPVRDYARTFKRLMTLPFEQALAPHHPDLLSREFLQRYHDGLTEEGFASAKPYPVAGYEQLPTRAFAPCPGALLVFRA